MSATDNYYSVRKILRAQKIKTKVRLFRTRSCQSFSRVSVSDKSCENNSKTFAFLAQTGHVGQITPHIIANSLSGSPSFVVGQKIPHASNEQSDIEWLVTSIRVVLGRPVRLHQLV